MSLKYTAKVSINAESVRISIPKAVKEALDLKGGDIVEVVISKVKKE